MSRRIKITFDIVTPESAEQGDTAENGWIDEEGIEIAPDEYEIDEAEGDERAAVVRLAVKEIGRSVEPSNWPRWHSGTWYTETEGDTDYSTGAVERRSFHLEGFSDDEERAIYAELCGR
jgi:hypothetical protein